MLNPLAIVLVAIVNPPAIVLAAVATLLVVLVTSVRGTGWEPTTDVSDEVLEHRASSVPETEFPEPGNRAVGGGGGGGAIPAGGAEGGEGELEEGGTVSSGPGDIPEDEVEYYEVEFVKQGETVELSNDEPILEQGEDEGWDLPYACRQGQCVSCAGQIADGPSEDFVEHDNQQMLEEAEIDDGYTLTCVAYPRDSFSIETGEAP
ncbi:2Fe-2S iron-sulfur cluster-binding protein [Halorubrum ezzemoulense]|jgi:2Fe-2S type ferredoxin|uniref:(2Fe-2S)-binding protein n=5 Tax=Halorubrum TaxID=56688 RepID=A0A256IWZ9_HALEZ|nr:MULTISPECIES: 2Fe-2S iron-sulfur cluster-binding protein [Halorubrum]MDB2238590.1 2Fe-2S iron-sulfur cluster-binding protein [Halorubrum ezzemoulense]MDB2246040.1 2Fe-2S iron-sulfur cluster-binding protein [Halorubrum ezzemoulense]MDB2249221.1 2Fe-2S iron-sulfur cluster-binding protein [Halorubrum ezzemoulense]MDB2252827.1 2Fe-2S iron-sulfur cluster-binding protein [Halorubrum ezzemoulense]MDB2261403.1 2Fe-2S iron-sulfur cluster-binding protein [Halorubrum ezzemoulense]